MFYPGASHPVLSRNLTPLCVAPNADISGLGVRVASSFLALLLFITTFIFVIDGFVGLREQNAHE
jgi:hypothetical protein